MKKLLPLAALLVALPLHGAVVVTNYITDVLGNPLWTRVVFTPFTPSTVFGGTNVIGVSVGLYCTNGVWSTEVLPGWYLVDQGDGQPTIPIFAEWGSGTNNLAYYASAATNPIPTFAYGISVTNVISESDEVWTNTGSSLYPLEDLPIVIPNDLYVALTNAAILATDADGKVYPTNELNGVTNINTTTITVSGKATLNIVNMLNATATNNFFLHTNLWSGPTNTIPMYLGRQRYVTWTPIEVTGCTGLSNYVVEPILLAISNAASTNVLATFTGFTSGGWTNQHTISNTSTAKIWFEYDPSGPDTNFVFRQMK